MSERECQLDLDRIAEEFAVAIRRGSAPSIEEVLNRHPDPSGELAELLSSVALLESLKGRSTTAADIPLADTLDLDELQDFVIVREIGRGGMGVVFEAIHQSLDRRVALKVLVGNRLSEAKQFARFRVEARAAARLRHSNIVPVFGVGSTRQHHYIVMDYIAGLSLRAWLAERNREDHCRPATDLTPANIVRQPIAECEPTANTARTSFQADLGPVIPPVKSPAYARWVAERCGTLCEALQYAHSQGVLHRDIKPANLLLDLRGELWIVDFGLAKLSEPSGTLSGEVLGTPQYMAPEAFEGTYDVRSEVYCIGLTLYELLLHRPAIDGKNTADTIRKAIAGAGSTLRHLNTKLPRDLETILLTALAHDPAMRYQSAGDLGRDLRRYLSYQPLAARRTGPWGRMIRWAQREPLIAALTVSSFALLSALAGVAALGYYTTDNALAKAQTATVAAEQSLAAKTLALTVADQQRARAEKNLQVALTAFNQTMQNITARGIEVDADVLGEISDSTAPSVTPQDAELLHTLLIFFDELAANNDEELLADSAIAAQRAGDIYVSLGLLEQANVALSESRRRYQRLSALYPDDTNFVIAQAQVMNELAVIASLRGELKDARNLFTETRDLLQSSDQALGTAAGTFELARAHRLFASVGSRSGLDNTLVKPLPLTGLRRPQLMHRLRNEWDLDFIDTAIVLLESLVDQAPLEQRYRAELARTYRTWAEVAWRAKARAEAQGAVRKSIDLFEALLAEHVNSNFYRYELATTLLCTETFGFNQMVRAARADELCRLLLQSAPTLPRYQALKARSLQNLARLVQKSGNYDTAESKLKDAETIYASLQADFPEVDAYATQHAQVVESIADIYVAQEKTKEAIEYLEHTLRRSQSRLRGGELSPAATIQMQRTRAKLNKLRDEY